MITMATSLKMVGDFQGFFIYILVIFDFSDCFYHRAVQNRRNLFDYTFFVARWNVLF